MKKVLNTWVLAVFLIFFIFNQVYGYTVDDVRDLLGKNRIDDTFSSSQIAMIIEQYEKIERANLYLRLLEVGKEFSPNKENYQKYQELQYSLTEAKTNLANSFQGGEEIRTVLKDKSNLESVLHKIEELKDVGYSVEVEYIPNTWEEKYRQVQEMVDDMQKDYEIGDVGEALKIPVDYSFILVTPFGWRLNEETRDSVYMHNGIDFKVKENIMVFSQWNGVVSAIYESKTEGLTVEISHGKYLKTVYSNLKDLRVKVGNKISQYDWIARANGDFIHLGVFLDDEYVNPIYLYGTKGLYAFQTFASDNPDNLLDAIQLGELIKDSPGKESKPKEDEESIGLIMDLGQPNLSFDKNTFLENIHADDEEKKATEGEGKTRSQILKEILNS